MTQLMDFLGDESEVFRDEANVAERVANRIEECFAGAGHPASVHRRLFVRRHFPIRGEAAEVIEADDVGESKCRAHPRRPPAEAAVAHQVPSIERIAPTLAGLAEVVGWDAGDDGRLSV